VKQALGTHGVVPALDFEMDVNFNLGQPSRSVTRGESNAYSSFKTIEKQNKSKPGEWEKLYEVYHQQPTQQDSNNEKTLTFSSSANERAGKEQSSEYPDTQRSIFQIHNRYIFSSVKSGVMIIDQELAHERILFERFMDMQTTGKGAVQQLLFPVVLELSRSDYTLAMGMSRELQSLGFSLEEFGTSSIKLTGAPVEIVGKNERTIFEGLLEQFKLNQQHLDLPVNELLARSLSKKASIKPGRILTQEELNALIDGLFACKNPNYSPEGRPTFYILGLPKIEEAFK
jgi:DNA mismatch repair protein MutL